jgi:hypothetical protein
LPFLVVRKEKNSLKESAILLDMMPLISSHRKSLKWFIIDLDLEAGIIKNISNSNGGGGLFERIISY